MQDFHGKLIVISSPSGGGKSTVIRMMLEMDPGLTYSVSATTRSPRNGEIHGEDYFFISEPEFKKKIQNDAFVEWAQVHGAYYGTLRDVLETSLDEGKTVLLDVDVQGGMQIKSKMSKSVLIFLYPPSFGALGDRLRKRGTDSPDTIKRRLEAAKDEIEIGKQYDYHVITSNIKETVREVITIINKV
ncbi:guanylate kinase [candidate division KSB1 bacterium]|nr:guanylate kinase [candidate division KSB1 bacterium]